MRWNARGWTTRKIQCTVCYFCIIWFCIVIGPRSVLGLSFVPEVPLVCYLSPRYPWTIVCPRGVLGLSFIHNVSWDYHLSLTCPGTIIYPQRVLGLSFVPPQGVPEAAADGGLRVQEMQEEHDVPAQAGISTTAYSLSDVNVRVRECVSVCGEG